MLKLFHNLLRFSIHNQNKNDEGSHTENTNESNITNDSLLDYFNINNLTFEEKEKYFRLNINDPFAKQINLFFVLKNTKKIYGVMGLNYTNLKTTLPQFSPLNVLDTHQIFCHTVSASTSDLSIHKTNIKRHSLYDALYA
ncbi:hypothetical protein H8356DRAFT_1326500 [Neocallimastix lanati (nom. inval.)]|nr:hypothetical protein H8356DRAFT_1326500 [Neocallimastix sp. JGI-2020a]